MNRGVGVIVATVGRQCSSSNLLGEGNHPRVSMIFLGTCVLSLAERKVEQTIKRSASSSVSAEGHH